MIQLGAAFVDLRLQGGTGPHLRLPLPLPRLRPLLLLLGGRRLQSLGGLLEELLGEGCEGRRGRYREIVMGRRRRYREIVSGSGGKKTLSSLAA